MYEMAGQFLRAWFLYDVAASWWPAAAVRIGPDVEALSVAAAAKRVCSDVAASITSVLTTRWHRR